MRRAIVVPSVRITVLVFVLFVAFAQTARPQQLTALTDDATGVQIAVPADFTSLSTSTGRRWSRAQGDIVVETMVYRDGTLRQRRDGIVAKPGRVITRNELIDGVRFVVEGRDPALRDEKPKLFHIEMYVRDGEIRGLSVIYPDANPPLVQTAQAIIRSFQPFPPRDVAGLPSGPGQQAAAPAPPTVAAPAEPPPPAVAPAAPPALPKMTLPAPGAAPPPPVAAAPAAPRAPANVTAPPPGVTPRDGQLPIGAMRGRRDPSAPTASPAETLARAAAASIPNPCDISCTPVTIFYGTDRARKDTPKRIAYDGNRARRLELGRAVVTVPRAVKRNLGDVVLPSWWEVTFRLAPPEGDPKKHFVIFGPGFKVFKTDDEFVADVQSFMAGDAQYRKEAFIFVHGYNTSFDDALFRTAQLAYDLGAPNPDGSVEPFGTAFMYSWPSGGAFADYVYDADSSRLAIDYLRSFIKLVADRTGAEHVHIIGHSMGNFALLHALELMAGDPAYRSKIEQVILAAPDIDAKEFRDIAVKIGRVAKGYTLYASANDVAMIASRRAHRDSPRAGDVSAAGPIIVSDVDSIDVSKVSMAYFSIHHNDYVEAKDLLNDIAALLRTGTHPPNERNANFLRLGLPGSVYWRYGQ